MRFRHPRVKKYDSETEKEGRRNEIMREGAREGEKNARVEAIRRVNFKFSPLHRLQTDGLKQCG